MMSKTDKLMSFTIRDKGVMSDDMIKHYVTDAAAKKGFTKGVEVMIMDCDKDKKVHETLTEYIHTSCSDITKHGYIDFVACGNVGNSFMSKDKYLGSVANALLRMRKMNCIFLS